MPIAYFVPYVCTFGPTYVQAAAEPGTGLLEGNERSLVHGPARAADPAA